MQVDSIYYKVLRICFAYIILPVVILWFGYAHVTTLFTGDFTQQLGSIEVSYIQMAKFIKDSAPAHVWQPMWYLGYPMELLYTPLVPYIEYFVNVFTGLSFSHVYRVLTALSYVLGGVSIYFFARELYRNTIAGYVSALIYTVLPSFLSVLHTEVGMDRFASVIEPRRFTILVRWGEGPHIVSLVFLPLSALFILKFLRKGQVWALILGALFASLTALTNSVGAWGLIMLIAAIVFGEMATQENWQQVFVKALLAGVISYGFLAFWFNPLFITTFFREGGSSGSFWSSQFPWGFIVGALIIGLYFFISKKIISKVTGLPSILVFAGVVFAFVEIYYRSGADKIELVPQVLRLTTEADMGIAILASAIVVGIGQLLKKRHFLLYPLAMLIIGVLVTIAVFPRQLTLASQLPTFTIPLELAGKSLTSTAEYQIAAEAKDRIVGQERVVMPGNYGFYLNYFTDVPQLRGALYQSSIHPWPDDIYYQLANGKDANISRAWLKIANVGWLIYSGPREMYRDFKVGTAKFDALGTRDGTIEGDIFYKIDLPSTSLAKAVDKNILTIKTPVNAIDEEPIFAYEQEIDQSNELSYKVIENGRFEISGVTETNQVILIQQAYAPGYTATDTQGRSLDVKKDSLGFLIILPKQAGEQSITLTLRKPIVSYLWWAITLLTWVLCIFLLIKFRKPLFYSTQEKTNESTPPKEEASEE